MGERRGAYRALVGKPEGRRPLKRPRCRWQDNIKRSSRSRVGAWTGSIWLGIGTGGGLLRKLLKVKISDVTNVILKCHPSLKNTRFLIIFILYCIVL
jgi:hypothetical protein